MENKAYNYSNFCGLFGYPIKHSLSPLMHNLSFEHHSIDWIYLVYNVNPGEFEKAVEGIKVCGIRGFNVTMPFKEKIIEFLDDVDDEVKKMGAVNTVNILDGKMTGYNTDHRGFYRSVENYTADIKNEAVIMFGAGGAAKAVLYSLLHKLEPDSILILDIAEEKINDLKKRVDDWGISNKNVSFDLTGKVPDLEDKIKSAKNFASLSSLVIGFIIFEALISSFKTLVKWPWFGAIQIITFILGMIALLVIIWATIYWMNLKEEGFEEDLKKAKKIIIIGILVFIVCFILTIVTEIIYY